MTVEIKFKAPIKDDTPAKCRLKIAKSTLGPECAKIPDKGKYTVQPVPAPPSTKLEANSKTKLGGNNQKLTLFKRGNCMSTKPRKTGINQLEKKPINRGIMKKKTMTKAWAVTETL